MACGRARRVGRVRRDLDDRRTGWGCRTDGAASQADCGRRSPSEEEGRGVGPARHVRPGQDALGDPDITGDYNNSDESGIPFERPDEFAGRALADVSQQELAKLVAQRQQQTIERTPTLSEFPGATSPMHWFENYYAANSRAWLVSEPADGKVPPQTDEARARAAARAAARQGRGPADSWEDRSLYDRCITRGIPGSMMPAIYGNSYHIHQSPGYVTLTYEMVHDTRVIPIDRGPHLRPGIRQYLGDARGHWEGNTLVVETLNFTDKTPFRGSSDQLRMVERFMPLGPDTVEWSVTFDDRTYVDPSVDVCDASHGGRVAAPVRVRLSRRQLRPAQHPGGGARRGSGRAEARYGSRTMRLRRAVAVCAWSAVFVAAVTVTRLDAQQPGYKAPRTPWGDPDIQGNYTNLTEAGTPLERPKELEGRRLRDIPPDELRKIKREAAERTITAFLGPTEAPDNWWQVAYRQIENGAQAWLVTDPDDGKIPTLTAEGQRKQQALAEARQRNTRGPADSYTDRSLYDRCITRRFPQLGHADHLRQLVAHRAGSRLRGHHLRDDP